MSAYLSILDTYWDVLLTGAIFTAVLSLASIALGVLFGLILAFGMLSETSFIRRPAKIYRSFWRGTPLLIQLLIIFYFLPRVGIELPPLGAAVIALTMNTAAFQAEIYRGGLMSIPQGQVEAARMLGIRPVTICRTILVPQMFRSVLPSLTNEATSILKNSSLISVIGVTELLRTGQQVVATTYRPLETYVIVAALYLVMTLSLGALSRLLERRMAQGQRAHHGV